ncbi:MAG: glycoside hydrolase family 2 [Clostridia bacterium]|nr:glycoside hydrolase family 2 [Clostridia bacterium]
MKTKWGENIDAANVLQEYPRPQMVRNSYMNLNGYWEYAITDRDTLPDTYDGTILVPFSPECELSGVSKTLLPNQILWYKKEITDLDEFDQGRVLIHFGAVDLEATVYLNGCEAGYHLGGYTPFSVEVPQNYSLPLTIIVKVKDYSDTGYCSRGKQKTERGGIWYTAQSGIWQTVWLESVPEVYIRKLRIIPKYDDASVELTVFTNKPQEGLFTMGKHSQPFISGKPFIVSIPAFISWTPENPFLYEFNVSSGDDSVDSYFGMRKFSIGEDDKGIKRLFLNNTPYFHNGLLDQGYWSDGMYTAPSDEALIFDIQTAKDMGFNMLRKHIKIEPLRWYYHCDRLGMLVWQDMMNGGRDYNLLTIASPLLTGIHFKDNRYKLFARNDMEGRKHYITELDEMINHLFNCTSIAMWVPFNEGWGQFDAEKVLKHIIELDGSRTVDHASGWHDQYIGDIKSLHIYFKKYKFKKDKFNRVVVLSEFGGYNYRIPDHNFNEKDFGYKKFDRKEDFQLAYEKLFIEQIIPVISKGLSAAVYTQLSDVEDEVNGLMTYDRKILKFNVEQLKTLNDKIRY